MLRLALQTSTALCTRSTNYGHLEIKKKSNGLVRSSMGAVEKRAALAAAFDGM